MCIGDKPSPESLSTEVTGNIPPAMAADHCMAAQSRSALPVQSTVDHTCKTYHYLQTTLCTIQPAVLSLVMAYRLLREATASAPG